MRIVYLITVTTFFFATHQLHAQYADCPGEGVCSNQPGETMTSGSINEINAVNCGCLPSSEAGLSYWYQMCITADGTICFTINPGGSNNDYDFAIWGPDASCPPIGTPMRCSHAATPPGGGSNGDVTGLSNAASDFNEGAGGDGWLAPINATAGQCYVVHIGNYTGTATSFNMIFTGSAGMNCSILPVELVSFTCAADPDGILLNWSCQTETNNSHFIVERTADGITYEFIERIEGAGTTSQPTLYSYLDLTAPAGTSYYRLTQVDYNGAETRYGPIACEYIPNGPTVMEIINMNGQVVFTGTTANYTQTFDEQKLGLGVYVIVLTRGISRQTFKRAVIDPDN